jgi:RHS repeat-associated protein
VAWYLTDRLGSVRDLVNGSTQAVGDHLDYEGFGNATETVSSYGDRYKYTAREWDVDTGLQYNRARFYAPSLGRFVERDSLGFSTNDANLYRYVLNQPSDKSDPSGNLAWDVNAIDWQWGGNYEWNVKFKPDAIEKNGFIIQEMFMIFKVGKSNAIPGGHSVHYPVGVAMDDKPAELNHYWEIWRIDKNGTVWPTIIGGPDATDAFKFSGGGGGTKSIETLGEYGKVYFDKGTKPAGAKDIEPFDGWKFWKKDHFAGAGNLLTSGQRPHGLVNTGLWRSVTETWNCTDEVIEPWEQAVALASGYSGNPLGYYFSFHSVGTPRR